MKFWKRLEKKGDFMGIPLHYLLIFLMVLLVLILIIVSASKKSGGTLTNLFGAMRGAG